jgi:general secretion pathway protein D
MTMMLQSRALQMPPKNSKRDSKPGRWIGGSWLIVALAAGALAMGSLSRSARAAAGDGEYNAGQKAERVGNLDEAFKQYSLALAKDNNNSKFLIAYERTKLQAAATHVSRGHRLREAGQLQDAALEYQLATTIDPGNAAARQALESVQLQIKQKQEGKLPLASDSEPGTEDALGPPKLQPLSRAPINTKMTNDSRVVLETLAKLAGVNILFHPDFQSKRITVEFANVTLEEALDQVMVLTKNFWKVLTRNTIYVIPDTAVNRREQEQQVIKTIYLSNTITPQELTEVVTAIRTLLETRRIQQINSMNAVIIRDTPDKVALAEKIIKDVDKAKAEIVVDVAVLETRRDKTRNLGFGLGNPGISVPFTFNPTNSVTTPGTTTTNEDGTTSTTEGTTTTTTSTSVRLNKLQNLSTEDWSVTLPGGRLDAVLGDSNTRILQRPEVRASDGLKATLRIGDRVPIATGAFQGGATGIGTGALVQTQFQYTDVGVNLDITPKVHQNNEITLKVRVEISAVTGRVKIGDIEQPVIGQRVIEHDIRLREGEVNVLGGIFQTQTSKGVSGVPGLSDIPLLKYLFSNVSDTLAENEVLIVLRPRALRLPEILPENLRAVDVGTEGDVRLRNQRELPDNSAAAPDSLLDRPIPATPAQPPAAAPAQAPPAGTAPAPGAATPAPGFAPPGAGPAGRDQPPRIVPPTAPSPGNNPSGPPKA